MVHFWVIFVRGNKRWGWRAEATGRGGIDVIAYRTKKEAQPELRRLKELYGDARLYKFKPDQFIFGASK